MRFRALIFLLAVAVVAVAGVAFAAKGGPKTVKLCAAKGSAALSAPKGGKCGPGARKVTIPAAGTPGAAGSPGAAGPAGAPGPAGTVPDLAAKLSLVAAAGPDCVTALVFCSDTTQYWGNRGEGFRPVGYRVDANGVVHLQGVGQAVSTEFWSSSTIFYLPPGLRPPEYLTFPARGCEEQSWERVYVNTDGAVSSTELGCIPLDGISFQP